MGPILCKERSHGRKSAMLESKLRIGTSKTKKVQVCLNDHEVAYVTVCCEAPIIITHKVDVGKKSSLPNMKSPQNAQK